LEFLSLHSWLNIDEGGNETDESEYGGILGIFLDGIKKLSMVKASEKQLLKREAIFKGSLIIVPFEFSETILVLGYTTVMEHRL